MDEALKPHWTEESTDDFRHHIAADFALQIENWLASAGGNQNDLADRLGVSPARVSQVLNNPGNMTLRVIVEYARKLGKKVAIVAYDDGDANNVNGPINSQVFEHCWRRAGCPKDFFEIDEAAAAQATYIIFPEAPNVPFPVRPSLQTRTNDEPVRFDVRSSGTDSGLRISTEPGVTNNG